VAHQAPSAFGDALRTVDETFDFKPAIPYDPPHFVKRAFAR
jgi:hypothetical protein